MRSVRDRITNRRAEIEAKYTTQSQTAADEESKKQKKLLELKEKNSHGTQLILDAMNNRELNAVIQEIEKRLTKAAGRFSKRVRLQRQYPDLMSESPILFGAIYLKYYSRTDRNYISFMYNTELKSFSISAEYAYTTDGGAWDPDDKIHYVQHFSNVEELVTALINGVAQYDVSSEYSILAEAHALVSFRDHN